MKKKRQTKNNYPNIWLFYNIYYHSTPRYS